MPSKKASSTEPLQQALNVWGHYTVTFERYALLHEILVDLDYEADTMTYFLGSLERHVQAQRIKALDEHWGGLDNGTPEQAEQVMLPSEEMMKLHGVTSFFGIPKAFMFLYLHAYLWKQLYGTGPYQQIKMIVDDLDPR